MFISAGFSVTREVSTGLVSCVWFCTDSLVYGSMLLMGCMGSVSVVSMVCSGR